MPPTIRVDEEVYRYLKDHAEPFVDSPNAVLRRLLELPGENGASSEADLAAGVTGSEKPARKAAKTKALRPRRGRQQQVQKGRRRAQTGTLLPLEAYELPILQDLAARPDGWAASSAVLDGVGKRLGNKLTDVDREKIPSGVVRWRNRAQFARLELVKNGDMAADSPRGVWEITDQGRKRIAGAKGK